MRAACLTVLVTGMAMIAPTLIAQPASGSADTNATIVAGLSLTRTVDLNFGDMFAPTTPGDVVVSPSGALTATGLIHGGGTVSAASFNVNQAQGVPRFYVTIPTSIMISNGTDTMVVSDFTTNVANPALCVTTGGPAPGPRGQCAKAPFVLNVGARLSVGAAQPTGAYSGTFNVTVSLF